MSVAAPHSDLSPVLADDTLVRKLFARLEAHGITYCLLRGWDQKEAAADGYEFDVLVDRDDLQRFRDLVLRAGFAAMPPGTYPHHRFYVSYDRQVRAWIKLDIVTDLFYGRPVAAWSFGDPADVLRRRATHGGLPILAHLDEIPHLVLHAVFDKRTFSTRHRDRIRAVYEVMRHHTHELDLLTRDFDVAFGSSLPWRAVADACERNTLETLLDRRTELRRRAIHLEPVRVAKRLAESVLARFLTKARGPRLHRGCLVALLGPDGAGKTTIAEGIVASAPFKVERIYMGHGSSEAEHGPWKGLARMAREVRTDQTRARSFFHRGRRWCARLTLQSVRSVEIRLLRAVGHLVVLDRHVLDFMLNTGPKSKARSSMSRWLQRVSPRPDVIVLLDAPPDVLQHRKSREHTLEELTAQRRAYVELCQQLPQGVIVDSAGSAADVRNEVLAQIWAKYIGKGRAA